MAKRILLYGATGFSGRLIAAEASTRLARDGNAGVEVVLGGRDHLALEALSEERELDHVVFALDDQARVEAVLRRFDVVLNAAGPFAETAMRLAKCAIATGCHYVDINGEVDVYQALDDLGHAAMTRGVAIVSGAGFTSMVSDVMLDRAFERLILAGWRGGDVHVRIAVARMSDFSRGSFITMLRSVREQVVLVQRGALAHVPVGRLERTFDFGTVEEPGATGSGQVRTATAAAPTGRIASAVNMLDTLTAFSTIQRREKTIPRYEKENRSVPSIESYVDMPRPTRLSYQLGALSTVIFQLPAAQRLARLQLAQLPDGPDAAERDRARETVIVNVASQFSEPWVDWRVETPSAYDVTASCALSVAARLSTGTVPVSGWVTPAQVVPLPGTVSSLSAAPRLTLDEEPFAGWTLESRPVFQVTP